MKFVGEQPGNYKVLAFLCLYSDDTTIYSLQYALLPHEALML